MNSSIYVSYIRVHNYHSKLNQWRKQCGTRVTSCVYSIKTHVMARPRLTTRINPFVRFLRVPAIAGAWGYQQNGEPLYSLQSPVMVTSTSPASAPRPRTYRCTCSAVAHAPCAPDAAEVSGCATVVVRKEIRSTRCSSTIYGHV